MKAGTRTLRTFVVTSIALFMVVLDNLVVSTALPVVRVDLGASIEQLEWIVNAYTLTFAAFLALLIPRKRRADAVPAVEADVALVPQLEAA
jgi:MFS family permease